jgi:hypothetical protein
LVFTALLFLCCAIYLLAGPLVDPVASHDAGVLVGAFAIALASILLLYLAKSAMPRRRALEERHQERAAGQEAIRPKNLTVEPIQVRRTRV